MGTVLQIQTREGTRGRTLDRYRLRGGTGLLAKGFADCVVESDTVILDETSVDVFVEKQTPKLAWSMDHVKHPAMALDLTNWALSARDQVSARSQLNKSREQQRIEYTYRRRLQP